MRTVVNILLGCCIILLVWLCWRSITGPINFEKDQKARQAVVVERLINIRKAQQSYRAANHGKYASTFDTLIAFVKTQRIPLVRKDGELTDDQLKNGLTEAKAVDIINKAKKTGNYSEVKRLGLEEFRRDTTWIPALDTLYSKGFNPDSMRYIPFGRGAEFELNTLTDSTTSGSLVYMFEVKAPYETYLNGLDHQEILNLKDKAVKSYKYPGLMIGSLETPNNGNGNWE